MANKTISLSDEAEVSLEKKRQEDISFNLSAFVSACLSKDFGINGKSIEELNTEIAKKKAQVQLLEAEIDELANQVKEILDKNEHLKKEQEDDVKWEKFKIDMDNLSANQTEEDKAEYIQGIRDGKWKGWVDYAKQKLGWKDD